jgi:hypothetical protein
MRTIIALIFLAHVGTISPMFWGTEDFDLPAQEPAYRIEYGGWGQERRVPIDQPVRNQQRAPVFAERRAPAPAPVSACMKLKEPLDDPDNGIDK